jgi:hypothetical protein
MPTPNVDQYLNDTHTALINLKNDAELNTPMAAFGYDAARVDAILALHNAASTAHFTQKTEYAEQYGASKAYEDARATVNTAYMRHLKLARVVYKNNVTRFHQLGLLGERLQSYAGWKNQADQFYKAALAEPAIQTDLATLGVTVASLQAAKALLDATDTAWNVQKREAGEAQEATKTRDAAFDALQEAYSDFLAVARVAFEDDPQKLERMGIMVPSEEGK